MEAAVSSSTLLRFPTNSKNKTKTLSTNERFICLTDQYSKSTFNLRLITKRRSTARQLAVINEVAAAAADVGEAGVTWQIVVGAIAGVTPFVVAGIEFSKRIIAQRRCEVCGGSGLVSMDKEYFRCPGCGGFLPWQSWKRFFSG